MRVCKLCHANLPDDPTRCGCGTPRPERGWPDDPLIGETLDGEYTVEARLGVGGMGVAYRAHDAAGRPVAIKSMHAHLATSDGQSRRFRREARAASALEGPHAVHIFGTGELPDGTLYIVMELVEGEQLTQRLNRGPMPLDEAVTLLRQLAVALAEAHGLGLVHRDLKPDNLLIADTPQGPHLKVLDFGIVKVLDERLGTVGSTVTGAVFGTPEYMAPEQAAGRADLDHRADIFSAGVVAYLMFTGRMPYGGPTVQAIMMARLVEDAPRMSTAVDWPVPASLDDLVAGMLAREPARRVQQMAQVIAALDGVPVEAVDVARAALRPVASAAETRPLRPFKPTPAPLPLLWPRYVAAGVGFVAVMLGVAWLMGRLFG